MALVALGAVLLAVVVWLLIRGGGAGDGRRVEQGPPLRAGMARGANLTAFTRDAFATPRATAALRTLRATGADSVTIPVLWYQTAKDSTEIAPDDDETPSDASVVRAMKAARALGMRVTLAPLVHVRDGTFRGQVAPADRKAWFASYAQLVDHFCALAVRGGARTLIVGSELTSMSRDTAAWQALIARARACFGGRLTFAANWVQGAEQIRFWRKLDTIGIDAYMPLAPGADPDVRALRRAWRPWVRRMHRLHRRERRPILVAELGYTSRQGTAQSPSREGKGRVAQRPQARAYQAALAALGHREWIEGIALWDWSADGRVTPGGYSPQGKRAQRTMTRWFGGPPSR